MKIPDPHPFFKINDAALYYSHKDFSKQLLFLVHAGLPSKPRGLFVFDIKTRNIIKRFENASTKQQLIIGDLNADGWDEFVVLGKANGNGERNVPYSDWTNWIFILNQNLNLLTKPLNFGIFPSGVYARFVEIKGKRYLLLAHYRFAEEYKNRPLELCLINGKGLFACRRTFPYNVNIKFVVDDPENLHKIYFNASSSLLCFDENLNFLKQKKIKSNSGSIEQFIDVNNDGRKDIITRTKDGIQIYDADFNLLGKYKIKGVFDISLRFKGADLAPELGVNGIQNYYHLKIIKAPIFYRVPFLFLMIFITVLIILLAGDKLLSQVFIFFSYFIYSLNRSQNAVVIMQPSGYLSYFNARTQTLLDIKEILKKKIHYQEAFKDFSGITDCITESMLSGETEIKELAINRINFTVKGEIRVIPFKTGFNYIYAYMMEIRDFTAPLLSDRHRVWSRTVRKIAHDIKTPLGSVLLNMERIQQKIENSDPKVFALTKNDISMTLAEIKRIQDMTRIFLKFSNLEAPNIQPLQFSILLDSVLTYFTAYLNNGIQMKIELEKEAHLIYGDQNQLKMALQIIIENAIDALKGHGKIMISSILAQNLEDNFKDYLEIEIADNGPGIISYHRDRLFEPFFSTKDNGTGMGLTIARKIIRDHKGEIELISKENYGTVFRIILPAKRKM